MKDQFCSTIGPILGCHLLLLNGSIARSFKTIISIEMCLCALLILPNALSRLTRYSQSTFDTKR